MKFGAYPSLEACDRNRRWEVYMHSTTRDAGTGTCFGALGSLGYHLSTDRSRLGLRERWANGVARAPRVAAVVGTCFVVSESVCGPFIMSSLPIMLTPLGYLVSRSLLGGLIAYGLGRSPGSAAKTGLAFGTAVTTLSFARFFMSPEFQS